VTRERSAAYRRLMRLIEAFGSDLLPEEQDQLRSAADALLFCERLENDREVRLALRTAGDLVLRRVVSGCAVSAVADSLLVNLVSCGPDPEGVPRAA
jgi:hypothetical protein